MNLETAKKLIEQNREVYDAVAENFAQTRHGKHLELIPLVTDVKSGDRILDLGSGSGKLFQLLKDRDVNYVGLDASAELVEYCKKTFADYPRAQFVVGDLITLPFSDNSFDSVYCIATLHHIPSQELCEKALAEMYRVLKHDGRLVMTNWYFWKGLGLLAIVKFQFLKLLVHLTNYSLIRANKRIVREFDLGDIFVPWGKTGNRYYHSFRVRELKKLVETSGFKNVKQYFTKKRGDHWGKRVNLITVAKK